MTRLALILAFLGACSVVVADDDDLSKTMTRRIDRLLLDRIAADGLEPAPLADDSEFLRRASLDLIGIIPRVAETQRFLADVDENKRERLIDELLASPRHSTHLANTWRQFMLPGGVNLGQIQNVAGLQNWLRGQFADNMRYDRVVSDFLVATGGGEAGPALYYTSLDLEPEKLAASTSRVFLGLQIECAQCHPHPFDHWTQEDFWGYAAFFARLGQSASGPMQVTLQDLPEGEVTLPDTETVVAPKYLDGRAADARDGGSRRVQLAIWVASRDNPYLAQATVNRVWSNLFGRGLVEPVDDLGDHNPASHPELMNELTDYFIQTGFDIRSLMRTLANTQAYQRTSRWTADEPPPPDLFATMPIKTMSAEQLYDCLDRVLMKQSAGGPSILPFARGLFDQNRLAFAAKMQMRGANATEFEAGVLQALTLLNGSQTAAITSVEQSGILAAIQAPWLDDAERVNTLFLATLCRLPGEQEQKQFADYVARGGANNDSQRALGDVLWALMNSAEFALVH